jgi:hypothetical protein
MFEAFRVYGFGFEYPKGCVISFGKKSLRRRGYIVMELAEELRITVSWGDLESKLPQHANTEVHAKHSLSRLNKASDLKELSLVDTSTVLVNGHQATLTHFRVRSAYPILAKSRNRETRSLHIHCAESNRFFILEASSRVDSASADGASAFRRLQETFVCH